MKEETWIALGYIVTVVAATVVLGGMTHCVIDDQHQKAASYKVCLEQAHDALTCQGRFHEEVRR